MNRHQRREMFKLILEEEARETFVPEFIAAGPEDIVLSEALGHLLIHFLDDAERFGAFMFSALYAGLEDENWHSEAGVFYEWRKQMAGGLTIGDVLSEYRNTREVK